MVLYVKRKSGHLPYTEDPRGLRGILCRSLDRQHRIGEDFIRRFSENALAHSFGRFFGNHPDQDRAEFSRSILLECTIHNKLDAMILYLELEEATAALTGQTLQSFSHDELMEIAENLRLLRTFFDSRIPSRWECRGLDLSDTSQHQASHRQPHPLIPEEFFAAMWNRIEEAWITKETRRENGQEPTLPALSRLFESPFAMTRS